MIAGIEEDFKVWKTKLLDGVSGSSSKEGLHSCACGKGMDSAGSCCQDKDSTAAVMDEQEDEVLCHNYIRYTFKYVKTVNYLCVCGVCVCMC